MTERIAEYRNKLLAVLAHLDQPAADAKAMLADPADTGNLGMIEEFTSC